jgi:hypothetical protein
LLQRPSCLAGRLIVFLQPDQGDDPLQTPKYLV